LPKVVPSQVVEFIDRIYPHNRTTPRFHVYAGDAAVLATIVSLSDDIPDELITISGDDYTDLVHGMEALSDSVTRWNQRGGDQSPNWIKGESPISVIRTMLAKCPDQNPSPETAELAFMDDADLRDSIRIDISQASSGLHNGDWKATTVLAGAAIEALLLWAITRDRSATDSLDTKPKGPPENWRLAELIDAAISLRVIKDNTASQARLAKDFRNLIHPGRALRKKEVCDRGTALTALAAVELVVRDLTP
jgi:hypothetical protein